MAKQMQSGATKRQVVRADAGARAQRAWSARVAGGTWAQVAELAGFSSGPVACRAVTRYFGKLPDLDREQQRALWRDRMEVLWAQSLRDAKNEKPGAVRSGVAVAQRAAALDGLDAPTRVDMYTPSAEEFNALITQLLAGKQTLPELEGDIFEDDDAAVYGQASPGDGLKVV